MPTWFSNTFDGECIPRKLFIPSKALPATSLADCTRVPAIPKIPSFIPSIILCPISPQSNDIKASIIFLTSSGILPISRGKAPINPKTSFVVISAPVLIILGSDCNSDVTSDNISFTPDSAI